MNIDLHFHHMPESAMSLARRDNPFGESLHMIDGILHHEAGGWMVPMARELYDLEHMLALMDERHVDMAAITPTPILYREEADAADVLAADRDINNDMARLQEQFPDRFAPLGIVPMQHPVAAVGELKRCMLELGLRGIEFDTNVQGANLDDPRFRPLWETAAELGAVVFLHPLWGLGPERLPRWYLVNLVGYPADTAVAVGSLIFSGILEDLPELKIVCAHGGGAASALVGRWERHWQVKEGEEAKRMAPEVRELPLTPLQ
ncbi:MAG: amidohydrolase family protein [Dehalococcoidia bacterium]|nr:amidohydrolase family protein [Dehalococcoidia bacterium]